MRKLRYVLAIALVVAVTLPGLGCLQSRESIEGQLETIFSQTASLRQLDPTSDVGWQFITPDELSRQMQLIFEADYPPSEAQIDEDVYVILDLMAEDQGLHEILLGLYSEQVIGYYDDDAKELYIVGESSELSPSEKLTLVHEYTHALQDQRFDLNSLPMDLDDNSDRSLAALSLVEGDAVLNQGLYYWTGLSEAERQGLSEEMEQFEDAALEAAPEVVRQNLLFPYEAGVNFVVKLFEQGGWEAVNRAYDDLPVSTEQILHPEKYYGEPDEPQAVLMPDDLESYLGEGWARFDTDVLGELNMRVYLEAFLDDGKAATAAAGWDGDRYLYLENVGDSRQLFILQSVWDTETDAEEFFDAYIDFVQNKGQGTWVLSLDEPGEKWWDTAEQSVYLSQQGDEVLLVIGPDHSTVVGVLTGFSDF